jgi:cell division protease FtsH
LLKYETISGEEFKIAFEQGLDQLTVVVEAGKEKIEEERRLYREMDEKSDWLLKR